MATPFSSTHYLHLSKLVNKSLASKKSAQSTVRARTEEAPSPGSMKFWAFSGMLKWQSMGPLNLMGLFHASAETLRRKSSTYMQSATAKLKFQWWPTATWWVIRIKLFATNKTTQQARTMAAAIRRLCTEYPARIPTKHIHRHPNRTTLLKSLG